MAKEGSCDIDYTAIPISWAVNVVVVSTNELDEKEAQQLIQSFIAGTFF